MILAVAHSKAARQALRNTCNAHEDTVVRRFGRAVLFEATEFGAFLALRLRAEHGADLQVERTVPLNEYRDVPDDVREAAAAYAAREDAHTPYERFAADTDHPDPETMREEPL